MANPNCPISAKRYERMMKAHGIHQPVNAPREPTTLISTRNKDDSTKQSPKKRKLDLTNDYATTRQDKTEMGYVKEECNVPEDKKPVVKSEFNPHTRNTHRGFVWNGLPDGSAVVPSNATDTAFNDFIDSGAFEPINGRRSQDTMLYRTVEPSEELLGVGQTKSTGLSDFLDEKEISQDGVVVVVD